MITTHLVRVAVIDSEKKPETARMHPAQVCAIAWLYEAAAVESVQELHSLEDIDAVRHLAKEYQPVEFMGMKIAKDAAMPQDQIEFLDENGDLIGRIERLAIPTGFYEYSECPTLKN